jgi:hypothetical protein
MSWPIGTGIFLWVASGALVEILHASPYWWLAAFIIIGTGLWLTLRDPTSRHSATP